jgi:hypothetical protein
MPALQSYLGMLSYPIFIYSSDNQLFQEAKKINNTIRCTSIGGALGGIAGCSYHGKEIDRAMI